MTGVIEDFSAMLEEAMEAGEPQRGDLLEGVILSIDGHGMIVDLGLKRDGVVPASDLEKLPSTETSFKAGDPIAVMVIDPVDQDGNLAVSISQARESGDWLTAHHIMERDEIIELEPCGANRGGLIVPFGRLRGFVPASHLSELPRGLDEENRKDYLKKLVGRQMPFKVIEVDPQRRRLVMSERKAIRQWRQTQKSRIMSELEEGQIRTGVVTSLRPFGAFVDIGGADGLIHISEISWNRVESPADVLEIGQEVETKIVKLDRDANRIGLSLKQLQPNPWQNEAFFPELGSVVRGSVSCIGKNGMYVRLDAGLEGLLRAKEGVLLPAKGMTVKVRVVSFEPEREHLDLDLEEEILADDQTG